MGIFSGWLTELAHYSSGVLFACSYQVWAIIPKCNGWHFMTLLGKFSLPLILLLHPIVFFPIVFNHIKKPFSSAKAKSWSKWNHKIFLWVFSIWSQRNHSLQEQQIHNIWPKPEQFMSCLVFMSAGFKWVDHLISFLVNLTSLFQSWMIRVTATAMEHIEEHTARDPDSRPSSFTF